MQILKSFVLLIAILIGFIESNLKSETIYPFKLRVPLMHLQGVDFATPRLGIEYENPKGRLAWSLELGLPVFNTFDGINASGYFAAAQVGNMHTSEHRRFSNQLGIRGSVMKGIYYDYIKHSFENGGLKYDQYLYSRVEKNRLRLGFVDLFRFKLFGRTFMELQLEAGYSKMDVHLPEAATQINFYNGLFNRQRKYEGFYMGGGFNL